MQGVETVERNIQKDHIHTVMIIPPKYAVSDVVARIKQKTSSTLRRKFNWLNKVYWQEDNVIWSPGYFVSTVGLDEEQIKNYVQFQEHRDSGQEKLNL